MDGSGDSTAHEKDVSLQSDKVGANVTAAGEGDNESFYFQQALKHSVENDQIGSQGQSELPIGSTNQADNGWIPYWPWSSSSEQDGKPGGDEGSSTWSICGSRGSGYDSVVQQLQIQDGQDVEVPTVTLTAENIQEVKEYIHRREQILEQKLAEQFNKLLQDLEQKWEDKNKKLQQALEQKLEDKFKKLQQALEQKLEDKFKKLQREDGNVKLEEHILTSPHQKYKSILCPILDEKRNTNMLFTNALTTFIKQTQAQLQKKNRHLETIPFSPLTDITDKVATISTPTLILIPCLATSKVNSCIVSAQSKVKFEGLHHRVLIIFHPRASHDRVVPPSSQQLGPNLPEHVELVVDVVFDRSSGLVFDLQSNKQAVTQLSEHFIERMK